MTPGPAAEPPAISLDRVTKSFVTDWRGRRQVALREVSLSVARGRVCALVGPNGSGKSTLLRICAGLTGIDSGLCRVGGVVAGTPGCVVGYVPDRLMLPPCRTVGDLLAQLARLYGIPDGEAGFAVRAVLRDAGLEREAGRRIGALSLGQRQRVAIAQALLGRPGILLLDEPGAGLDPRALEQLADVIRAQRAAGRTVLLSSHFLPQVEQLAGDIVLLEQGRVLYAGRQDDLAARGGLRAVYLEAVRA
ncbi:MAG: ABC transporter [Opitutus sp.]|nr:ABC transporter [Opitutus sp.]